MSILSHLSNNIYLDSISKLFDHFLKKLSEPHFQLHSLDNYVELIENTAQISHEIGRTMLVNALEKMDLEYKNSNIRKQYYHVKVTRERTLITVFGQISFKRTIYEDKATGKSYTYLDRKLGLPKYDRYDPTVKAMIVELYSNQNSMIKVGEIIGSKIFSPFTTSNARHSHRISRQTVHNIVSKVPTVKQGFHRRLRTPKVLYIMADEKYVALQSNKNKKSSQMLKHAVIFEGVENINKRGQLINKINIASTEPEFWEKAYNTMSSIYDLDEVRQIYILGDGALWIKKGVEIFGHDKASFALDKFHFKQAIHHIDQNDSIKNILTSHILLGKRSDFKMIIDVIKTRENNRERHKIIEEKAKYILNQWIPIRKAYKEVKVGCSMESAISHNLASIYTSRPKAYKPVHLEKYLHTRMQYLNGIDIQNHYLKTQHLSSNVVHEPLAQETFDYSIFEPKAASDHSISRWFREFTIF